MMNIPKYINEFERELKLDGKAKVTIETYKSLLRGFLNRYGDRSEAERVSGDDIKGHLVGIKSPSTLIQVHSVLNIFYTRVVGQPSKVGRIAKPKRKQRLPVVLSQKEAVHIINQPQSIKHRAMMYVLYSSGVRINELLSLKLNDIDSDRMVINVWHGKGDKDRITILSKATLVVLRAYYLEWKPKNYLFESPTGGKYSDSSVNKIIARAARECGITKKVTAHTFRHTFATQLLENKVDLFKIQKLMGHSSIKTTQIYLQVSTQGISEVVSPLDYAMAS